MREDVRFLKSLRRVLNNQKYEGVMLSNILGANITLAYWQGVLTSKPRTKLTILFYFIYTLFIRDFYAKIRARFIKNQVKLNKAKISHKIVLEALSSESRLQGFWYPLAKKLGIEKCVVLTPDQHCIDIDSDINFMHVDSLKLNSWLNSRVYIIRNIVRWYKKSSVLKSEFPVLNHNFQLEVILILISQISVLEKAIFFKKEFNPKSYVSIWDWSYLGSACCSIFNKYKIPTYTFVHGALGKRSMDEFVPLNANYVFTWGNYMSNLFIKSGVKKQHVLTVGIQRVERYVALKESEIFELKRKFKIMSHKTVILLAFTAVISKQWVKNVIELIKGFPDFRFIIRPHPSTLPNTITDLFPVFNNVIILSAGQVSLKDSIDISDVVVVESSTAGFDALIQQKPVFVLDSLANPQFHDIMIDAIDCGAVKLCTTASELGNYFKNADYKRDTDSDIAKNRDVFVNDYIDSYGNWAVKKIEIALLANN